MRGDATSQRDDTFVYRDSDVAGVEAGLPVESVLTNATWMNAPIVYAPTMPSRDAIKRMTAKAYSMAISLQVRVDSVVVMVPTIRVDVHGTSRRNLALQTEPGDIRHVLVDRDAGAGAVAEFPSTATTELQAALPRGKSHVRSPGLHERRSTRKTGPIEEEQALVRISLQHFA